MGNYRFKLSDMIPNAWFYKLRDIGRGKKQTIIPTRNKKQSSSTSTTQPSKPKQLLQCNPRKSYYFTRELNPTNTKFYTSPTNNPKTPPHTNNSTEPPRKPTSKQRTRRRRRTNTRTSSPKLVSSTVSAGCNCRTTLESVWTKSDSPHENSSSPFDSSPESEFPDPEFRTDRVLPTESSSFDEMVLLSTSCSCRLSSNTTTKDIVMDVDKNSLERKDDKLEKYDAFSQLELPPIITKPQNFNHLLSDAKKKEQHNPRSRISTQDEEQGSLEVKIVKEDIPSVKKQQQRSVGGTVRRFSSHSVSSPGLKLRVNSPRIVGLKFHSHGRKSVSSTASSGSRRSLSDSFAIVKSSFNPQKDFRESMVEMIVENNIRASKDLEDLLACYLSLNSDEYHDLIIKVFKQIWFDLTETR